jgi:hypothetical protein
MNTYMTKRKCVTKYCPSKKRRLTVDKTITDIINKTISKQKEKKFFNFTITSSQKRVFQNELLGSSIVQGSKSWQRDGNQIRLKSLSLRGVMEATLVGTTLPPATNKTSPVYFQFYVVESTTVNSLQTRWFLPNGNNDNPVAFSSYTNDATGDNLRMMSRLNTKEFKILHSFKLKQEPLLATTKTNSTVINKYFNINKVITYSNAETDTVPYAFESVRPNIFLVWYQMMPDLTAIDDLSLAFVNMRCSLYFEDV